MGWKEQLGNFKKAHFEKQSEQARLFCTDHMKGQEPRTIIAADYGEMEKVLSAKVSSSFENFDPYTHVAEKHNIPRNEVKVAAYHIFYTTNLWLSPEPTKEEVIKAIEEQCRIRGIIK